MNQITKIEDLPQSDKNKIVSLLNSKDIVFVTRNFRAYPVEVLGFRKENPHMVLIRHKSVKTTRFNGDGEMVEVPYCEYVGINYLVTRDDPTLDVKAVQLYIHIFKMKPYKLLSLSQCWRLWKNLHNEPTHFPIKLKVPNWFRYELKKMLNTFDLHWYIEDSSFARKAGATNDVYRICGTPQLLVHLCDLERPEYKGE